MVRIQADLNGVMLKPHWYDPKGNVTKADRFGKKDGYRFHPVREGHNASDRVVFHRSLEDVADHPKACPDWGLRFETPVDPASILYAAILIDGVLR